jgi:Leucine-rich repeat (LRR) protein
MRFLFICFLLVASYGASAQNVRLMAEVPVPEREVLTKKYKTDRFNSKNQQALHSRMDSVIKMVFPVTPQNGIALYFEAMVGEQGIVEQVIFDLFYAQNYNKDSLANKFKYAFAAQVAKYRAPEPGFPFLRTFQMGIGKFKAPREVRKADSSLTDVKQAIAFADTLSIKRLFFNDLGLKEIPQVVYRYPNLDELYLGKNSITEVDLDLSRLPKLSQLHLQGNQITSDKFKISKNRNLKILNLNENMLENIPAMGSCKRLTTLWLGGNQLTKLTNSSFRHMRRVKDLNFYKGNIAVLPSGIRKMKRLEVLDLYYNKLTMLPKGVMKLRNLTHLAVSNNELTELPEKLYKLKRVHTLYAHHNHLSKLPKRIGDLKEMRILDLGYNWFTDFPTEITAFSNLEELELSANNFLVFPKQLLEIKHLDKLFLRGNPFIEDRPDLTYASQLDNLKSKNIEVFH